MSKHGRSGKRVFGALGLGLMLAFALGGSPALGQTQTEDFQLIPADVVGSASGFASSVALDGNYLVAGAAGDDDLVQSGGAVYVFKWNGSAWVEQVKLFPSVPRWQGNFGTSVAISGDRIVIGEPFFDTFPGPNGVAYVFRREGANWVEEARLIPSSSVSDDRFGMSVAIVDDVIGVGAFGHQFIPGSAFVFRRKGTAWVEQAKLNPADSTASDGFGVALDMVGGLIAVGAYRAIGGCPGDESCTSGAAYIFRDKGTAWEEEAKLVASDAAEGDGFGGSIFLDDTGLAVGATQKGNKGAAYLFRRDGTQWSEEAKFTASDAANEDSFGASLALTGDLFAVGAPGDDDGASGAGSVYFFRRFDGDWFQAEKLRASDPGSHPFLGGNIALRCDKAFVAASRALYVYTVFDACPPPIPSVSHWGLVSLVLLLLACGTILLRRHAVGRASVLVCVIAALFGASAALAQSTPNEAAIAEKGNK